MRKKTAFEMAYTRVTKNMAVARKLAHEEKEKMKPEIQTPTKVILLNGPPNSGKDAIAKHLATMNENFYHKEFKSKLYQLTQCIYDVSEEFFWKVYSNRELKETPMGEFGGLSIRQAMIKVSEEVIKPVYGREYFGLSAAKNLVSSSVNVFSDSGFIEELRPVCNSVGRENILLIKLYRDGCDFKNDSRDYLNISEVDYYSIIENDGTLEDLFSKVEDAVCDFLSLGSSL